MHETLLLLSMVMNIVCFVLSAHYQESIQISSEFTCKVLQCFYVCAAVSIIIPIKFAVIFY